MRKYAVKDKLPHPSQDDTANKVRHEKYRAEECCAFHRLSEHIGNGKGQDIDNNRCYYGKRYSEQERMEERPVSENALVIL